jgi:hypothetical protein
MDSFVRVVIADQRAIYFVSPSSLRARSTKLKSTMSSILTGRVTLALSRAKSMSDCIDTRCASLNSAAWFFLVRAPRLTLADSMHIETVAQLLVCGQFLDRLAHRCKISHFVQGSLLFA